MRGLLLVERQVAAERERAVLVDLRDALELGVVIAGAELDLVVAFLAGDEPREVVLDLIVRVPRSLRFGARADEQLWMIQLRRAQQLASRSLFAELESFRAVDRTLRAETGVAVPPVLPGARHAHGVDAAVADHAGQRADGGLIEIGLVLVRLERLTIADGVPLRRVFAQPADGPGVRLADLMVEADQRIPVRYDFPQSRSCIPAATRRRGFGSGCRSAARG